MGDCDTCKLVLCGKCTTKHFEAGHKARYRIPRQYKRDYAIYYEAKKEINEEPLPYENWKELEEQAQKEWRETK